MNQTISYLSFFALASLIIFIFNIVPFVAIVVITLNVAVIVVIVGLVIIIIHLFIVNINIVNICIMALMCCLTFTSLLHLQIIVVIVIGMRFYDQTRCVST